MLNTVPNTTKSKFQQAAEIFFITEVQKQPLEINSSNIPRRFRFWSFSLPGAAALKNHHRHASTTTNDELNKLDVFENFTLNRKKNNCDDLYHCLRPLLIVARLFGLLPIQGIFSNGCKTSHNLKFKWISTSTIISTLICCTLFILSGLGFLNFFKESEHHENGKAEAIKHIIFGTRAPIISGVGAILYTLFLTKSPALLKLFKIWRKSSESSMLKGCQPKLIKHINLVGFTLLAPGTIHSTFISLSRFGIFDDTNGELKDTVMTNVTISKSYYSRYGLEWIGLSDHNVVLTAFLFIIWNLATFSLLFCDVLIISISILLYKKFQGLNTQAGIYLSYYRRKSNNRLLMFRKTSIESIARDHLWSHARLDHLMCTRLVWEADEILSPFIFTSFATSIYFICVQMHQGVTLVGNHGSHVEAILSGLLLIILIIRVVLVSLMAARVHEKGLEISHCVQKCPNGIYNTELERLERMLSRSSLIGLTGLGGCFIVNKALLLVIGSVIFTFEIVLFQASSNSLRVDSNKIIETVLNSTPPPH